MDHFEAELHFLSTESGGRKTPVTSGYRPQLFYDDRDWDAVHEYPGSQWVQPGETVNARIRLVSPDAHAGRIRVGMPFLIREGSKTVAYGVVKALGE